MNSFEKMKLRMTTSGLSEREEKLNDAQRLLSIENTKDISFCDTLYFWNIDNTITPTKVNARVFERKYTETSGYTMKFQTLIDQPVVSGNIIHDTNTNKYLICIESHNDYTRYYGKLAECNWILKWQKADGTILSYPCINQSQSSIGGEEESKTITLGDTEHLITLPFDENTVLIRSPQRFFLDKHPTAPTTYKTVQNNNTEYEGLVKITIDQDELKGSTIDRVDLGICDYFIPKEEPHQSGISYGKITYLSNQEVKIGGSYKKFTYTAYDESDNIVTTVSPIWTLTASLPEFQQYVHYNITGNVLKLKVDYNTKILNTQIKLEAQDLNGDYYSSILVNVVVGV